MFTFHTKLSMMKAVITKAAPFYIQFYISKECYLKCGMCNIVAANSDVGHVSLDDIEKIADNLIKIGAGVVLLTGGEPFLRRDIAEIVHILKSRKLDVRLQTSGFGVHREMILRCAEYGARDINISFDSLDEGLSDYINGVSHSWRQAIKTISFVSGIFPRHGALCGLGCVLSRYNLGEIDALLEFATRIGWWLSLVPAHITSIDKPMNFRGKDRAFVILREDFCRVKDLVERLKIKKKQGALLFDSDAYLDSMYNYIVSGETTWRHNAVCDSPGVYFAILPDGRFAPCCDFRLNDDVWVQDPIFPDIYRSGSFRSKVRKIISQCPGCNFGSFPEMTLSIRSFSALSERIRLSLKLLRAGVKPYSEQELLDIISQLKQKYGMDSRKGLLPLGL